MYSSLNRRRFLKTTTGAAVGLTGLGAARLLAAEAAPGAPHAEKLGWRLACALYTFNQFSFCEGVEKTKKLGLRYAEGFTWQRLSQEKPGVQTNESMPAEACQQAREKLAQSGVKLVSIYCQLSDSEEANRRMFQFARGLGIEILVSEPPIKALPMVDKLCEEFQIKLAIHNHPKPSSVYWNPDVVVQACKGLSQRIGACADTGHWVRSGINPVDALKKLEGRIQSFHLKDLNEFGNPGAHDVPWGTGKGNIKAVLREVRRQAIKPVFSIEYERQYEKTWSEIVECIAFFDKVAAELA